MSVCSKRKSTDCPGVKKIRMVNCPNGGDATARYHREESSRCVVFVLKRHMKAWRVNQIDEEEVAEKAYITCDDLPPLVDVDFTAVYVDKVVASSIQRGAGPGDTMTIRWQDFLLRYGAHSERLRDVVTKLGRQLANTVVEWDDICALTNKGNEKSKKKARKSD